MTAEDDAQTAYEQFLKDTNESITEKEKELVNKSEERSKAEADRVEHQVQLDETNANLDQLASELHDMHINCDYLMKNFELRQSARDEEIDALRQGLTLFSGPAFSSYL